MVAGGPDERKAVPVDRLERDPSRERRRLPGRLRADGVGVELRGPVNRPQQLEVAGGVNATELLHGRAALDRLALEHEQPVLPLGMVPCRMEVRERVIRQELDSASNRPASRPSPHSSASAAA